MSSDEKLSMLESLSRQVGEYASTRAKLLKLTAVAKASELASSAAEHVAVYLIASRTALLLTIAGAFLLGEWLGRYSYGFFIAGGLLGLAGLLVYFRRGKWIKDPVARLVITKMLE